MKVRTARPRSARGASPPRWLWILTVLAVMSGFLALSAQAASVDCLPMQQPLVKIPEIVSGGGRLRGTVPVERRTATGQFPHAPAERPRRSDKADR